MPVADTARGRRAATLALALLAGCTSTLPEWREEPEHVSLLVASTDHDGKSAATFGFDYEHRTPMSSASAPWRSMPLPRWTP